MMYAARHCRRLGLAAAALAAALAASGGVARATYPASNGKLAFSIIAADGNTDVWSVRPDGHGARQLTSDPAFDACPAYSPDGRQIAFCSNRSGAAEIWSMRSDGTHQRPITRLGGFAVFPDYSPDGRWIAFDGTAGSDPNNEIYVVDRHGNRLVQLTGPNSGNNFEPVWSPSRGRIAFISDRSGLGQVWVMNTDGSDQRQLTVDPILKGQLPDWSPDGRKLAYQAGDEGSGRIFVIKADGSYPRQLTFGPGDDFGAAWSPDGRQIAFVRDSGALGRSVFVMNADGSDQHPVNPGGIQLVPAWQPRERGDHDDHEWEDPDDH
jgi:TolB protein